MLVSRAVIAIGHHVLNRLRVDNMAFCGVNRLFGKSNDVLDSVDSVGFWIAKVFAITPFGCHVL